MFRYHYKIWALLKSQTIAELSGTFSSLCLTTFTYLGETTFDEIFQAVKAFYEGTPSRFTLWDGRDAILNLTAEQFHELNTFMRNYPEGGITSNDAAIP